MVSRKEAQATQQDKGEGIASPNRLRIHACVLPAIVQQPLWVAVFPGPQATRQQPQRSTSRQQGRMSAGRQADS
jgi:hypothetical protein